MTYDQPLTETKRNQTTTNNRRSLWLVADGKWERGITLLLVVLVTSAILSVSLGIFNVIFGQLKISGEINDSFIALYAADQGIEKILYRDRNLNEICPVEGPSCYIEGPTDVPSGGCYKVRVNKVSGQTEIIVSGQYRCGASPPRVVKRGLQVTY